VDLSGWVGVGLGGNCDCRCGILYALMLEEGAYKIPHLQSQFPPNPTPTQPQDPHPATYKFIYPIDIPPNLA